MKGTTKSKIHVAIKDVTKVTDHKGKKYNTIKTFSILFCLYITNVRIFSYSNL